MINYDTVRFDLPNRGYRMLGAYLNVRRNSIACCNSFSSTPTSLAALERYVNNYWKNKLAMEYPSKGLGTTVSWFQLFVMKGMIEWLVWSMEKEEGRAPVQERTGPAWSEFQQSAISSSVIGLETTVRFFAAAELPINSARCAILPDWDAHNEPEPSQILDKSTNFHLWHHKIMAPVSQEEPRYNPQYDCHLVLLPCTLLFCGSVSRLRKRPLNVGTDNSMTKVASLITRDGVDTRKIGIKRWTLRTD